jgi:hypothetical protein
MMAKVNRSLIELILYSGVGLDLKLLKRTEKWGQAFQEDQKVGASFLRGPKSVRQASRVELKVEGKPLKRTEQ